MSFDLESNGGHMPQSPEDMLLQMAKSGKKQLTAFTVGGAPPQDEGPRARKRKESQKALPAPVESVAGGDILDSDDEAKLSKKELPHRISESPSRSRSQSSASRSRSSSESSAPKKRRRSSNFTTLRSVHKESKKSKKNRRAGAAAAKTFMLKFGTA
mmetsp:Transcript_17445/g.32929  ORF Transcript_17445/g.32929 Transcript_17445/m.32929 type:complete len:157 (-) Transcript_17445:51-521(-)